MDDRRTDIFLGVMTGTSLDGVDVAAVRIDESGCVAPVAHATYDWSLGLREQLQRVVVDQQAGLKEMACLEASLTDYYADCIQRFLQSQGLQAEEVRAIGCHGQTVCHVPEGAVRTSWQLMDGGRLAYKAGIDVVCDFRRADLAAGGQGAPLVPPFHQQCFGDVADAVLNLGGIANLSYWREGEVYGYDVGPGNTLMDIWHHRHHAETYDADGTWAASGRVIPELLQAWLADPYLKRPSPKSTGREYFNAAWLSRVPLDAYRPEDVQRTLLALTVEAVAADCQAYLSAGARLVVCGGGAHNSLMMDELRSALADFSCLDMQALGFHEDAIEAQAFSWLAHARLTGRCLSWNSVTGSRGQLLLGAHYCA